jgi:hypothetical protein
MLNAPLDALDRFKAGRGSIAISPRLTGENDGFIAMLRNL